MRVYYSISWYITVWSSTYHEIPVYPSMGAHCDSFMRYVGQPFHVREEGDIGPPDVEGGPNSCPKDEVFFKAPDAESMEEAIGKFMESTWKDRNAVALLSLADPTTPPCARVEGDLPNDTCYCLGRTVPSRNQ
jgi:hypothetical protein